MCLAIPAQIMVINENVARVNVMGVESEVNIQLIHAPKKGDYVLIHAGCAIQKIDTEYYHYLQETLAFIAYGEEKDENARDST